MTHVLAVLDKFKGTATAAELATAVASAAAAHGATSESVPISDGGEGLLEVFGPANRWARVSDAAGRPVEAPWCYTNGVAVVESARSNGLQLVGGAEGNDPIAASTYGVGELLAAALSDGPRHLVVGVGGSATTDGGIGAITALRKHGMLATFAVTDVVVACDVDTRYVDAARVFGAQKGADAAQREYLTDRLRRSCAALVEEFGVDVTDLPGGGAAGGLAGALAALGARLEPGVDIVADHVGLDAAIDRADVVVTGEGRLDATSLLGKVVGAVVERARRAGRPVLIVCGVREPAFQLPGATVVSLAERVDEDRARSETVDLVRTVVNEHLAGYGPVAR